jgi:hypothetical protein
MSHEEPRMILLYSKKSKDYEKWEKMRLEKEKLKIKQDSSVASSVSSDSKRSCPYCLRAYDQVSV